MIGLDKLALLKLKKIVYKQISNMEYYENTNSISDIYTILKEDVNIDGNIVEHSKFITCYLNGYRTFGEKYTLIKTLQPFGIEVYDYDLNYAKKKARKIN